MVVRKGSSSRAICPSEAEAAPVFARHPEGRSADPLVSLAIAASHGDAAARRELVTNLAPHLRRALRAKLYSNADVDDVLQESLVAIVRALPSFRGGSTFLVFSLQVARRRASTRRRFLRREARGSERISEHELPLVEGPVAPHECLVQNARRRALSSLLRELPPAQARTVELRIVHDYSLDEVASETGAPINTVRTRLRLARCALRRRIEADPALAELLDDLSGPRARCS